MKQLKSWLIGAGVAICNIIVSIPRIFSPASCTGKCGTCGFSCIPPVILGLVGVGGLVILLRKFTKRLRVSLHNEPKSPRKEL